MLYREWKRTAFVIQRKHFQCLIWIPDLFLQVSDHDVATTRLLLKIMPQNDMFIKPLKGERHNLKPIRLSYKIYKMVDRQFCLGNRWQDYLVTTSKLSVVLQKHFPTLLLTHKVLPIWALRNSVSTAQIILRNLLKAHFLLLLAHFFPNI